MLLSGARPGPVEWPKISLYSVATPLTVAPVTPPILLRSLRNHRKWKDGKILHRSYVLLFLNHIFWIEKNILFFSKIKNFKNLNLRIFGENRLQKWKFLKIFQKSREKNRSKKKSWKSKIEKNSANISLKFKYLTLALFFKSQASTLRHI